MNFMKELNELKTNKRSPRVIHHYCMDVDNYSYFDSKFIGDFLADLVSIYEGKDFIYQDTILENDSENKRVKLIIAKEYLQEKYNGDLEQIINNGNALVLYYSKHLCEGFAFYKAEDYNLNQISVYGKFNYVKELVDLIVEYRIKNEINNITIKDLNKFKAMFLRNNTDQILTNYSTNSNEKTYKLAI